jgi:hypothetical protein
MEDARAARIIAEGLLCKGVAFDDPWSLEAALAYFLPPEPTGHSQQGLFAGLYRASALTRRYPLSDEIPRLIEQLGVALESADVGAARDELRLSLAADVAAIERRRSQFLPRLQRIRAKLERGDSMTVDEVLELIALESQTGRAGVIRAAAILDGAGRGRVAPGIVALYRAELARGLEDQRSTLHLYEIAKKELCGRSTPDASGECQRVRHRIDQLNALMEGESP